MLVEVDNAFAIEGEVNLGQVDLSQYLSFSSSRLLNQNVAFSSLALSSSSSDCLINSLPVWDIIRRKPNDSGVILKVPVKADSKISC